MRLLAITFLLGSAAIAACGGGRSGSTAAPSLQRDMGAPRTDAAPTPVEAAPAESSGDAGTGDEEDPGTACASWCTLIAVCWEEVNDAEYNHGGICTVECTDKTEGDRRAFGRCVTSHADDCPAMLSC